MLDLLHFLLLGHIHSCPSEMFSQMLQELLGFQTTLCSLLYKVLQSCLVDKRKLGNYRNIKMKEGSNTEAQLISLIPLHREISPSQRKWIVRKVRQRECTWLQQVAMDNISPKSITSTLFKHNFSICITYGVWVWWGHGVIYWKLFLCKSSSVRRNYGTPSLALEKNSGQTCTIKTSF